MSEERKKIYEEWAINKNTNRRIKKNGLRYFQLLKKNQVRFLDEDPDNPEPQVVNGDDSTIRLGEKLADVVSENKKALTAQLSDDQLDLLLKNLLIQKLAEPKKSTSMGRPKKKTLKELITPVDIKRTTPAARSKAKPRAKPKPKTKFKVRQVVEDSTTDLGESDTEFPTETETETEGAF